MGGGGESGAYWAWGSRTGQNKNWSSMGIRVSETKVPCKSAFKKQTKKYDKNAWFCFFACKLNIVFVVKELN